MGIGDWGLGIGDWGVGVGPNPQSPIPNPQSPIPNFNKNLSFLKYIYEKNILLLIIILLKMKIINISLINKRTKAKQWLITFNSIF